VGGFFALCADAKQLTVINFTTEYLMEDGSVLK